jgi:Ser/Thr protein kinase RdoA (MazF antagonist)
MKLEKKDFEYILKNYELGKYKNTKHIWWAFSNTIFILETSEGKYILKLFHTNKLKHIRFQVNLIDNLNQKGLPLPKIYKNKRNKLLLKYKTSYLSIQEFVEGDHTYSFNKKLILDCSKILSLLDKELMKENLRSNFGYKTNHQFSYSNFKIKRIGKFNLKKEALQINKELKKINKKKLRKSFIHGDFHGVNLLSKNNKITAILDFDDSHYDYLIEEISVFLAHSFVHKDKVYKDFIKIFMEEYQRNFKFNNEEKKAIYYFIKQRFLASLDWTEKHKRKLKDEKKIKEINKHVKNSITSYNNFKKITLAEFLKLMD